MRKTEETTVLTARQLEVLDFIRRFVEDEGYPPTIREIAQHFAISIRAVQDHLAALEGKGCLKRSRLRARGLEIERPPRHEEARVRDVPLVGRIAAGSPILAVENVEGTIPIASEWASGEDLFLLRVAGESMVPTLCDGDYVLVRCQPAVREGEIAVALLDGEVTVKRFHTIGGTVVLKPDNEAVEPITLAAGQGIQLRILGKVIGVYRRL